MEIILYVLAGLAGGLLGGMGMGGGTLLIPLLTIALKIPQQTAQLINLCAFVPMSILALFVHIKNGFVEKRGLAVLIISAAVFAIIGSNLAVQFAPDKLQEYFGWFLICLGAYSILVPKKT